MRRLLPAALLAVLTVAGSAAAAAPSSAEGDPMTAGTSGRFDRPWNGFAPASTVLRNGTPEQVGLDPAPIEAALRGVEQLAVDGGSGRPMFSAAVTLLVHDGVVVAREATGYALRYAQVTSDGEAVELPREEWVPARTDTIFDMASVSKLFTSIVVLQQVEAGRVDLDAPVARYLPEFAEGGKETVTVKQLLTHTSGLPAWLPLWQSHPDRESRIQAALRAPTEYTPGTGYVYSDLNLIALGVLVERVTGSTLDTLVRQGITEPLGMRDTGYNPPASVRDRVAATEYQANPPRGMVRGEVHDENAWSLGGVAGHAGVFSTADDMAILGQAILNGGSYRGARILRPDTVRLMLTNYNQAFPENSHGLGFELDQRWYMDGLSGPRTAGHTGFTGTSIVIDPASRSIAVLLTNRVHPTRNWGGNNPARRLVAQGLAQALGVRPVHGPDAWFSGVAENANAVLSTGPLRAKGTVRVSFDAFVDTQNDPDGVDQLVLESSADGVTWQTVPMVAHGPDAPGAVEALSGAGHRRWWQVRAELPAPQSGELYLRWRYTSDSLYTGRGVYLDGIRVWSTGGVLLDGEREPGRLTAEGWRLATR